METDMERKLWGWLYKSQLALAKRCLADVKSSTADENEWPCGQEWDDLAGSSKAIFLRMSREECEIDDKEYLDILRNDKEALVIVDMILSKMMEDGDG